MYVLGIESATPVAAVAVAGEGGILAERTINNGRTHSVNLLPMIKATMEDSGIDRSELLGIAVSGGPGSFTGLRIGMSTAKALAQVWGLPVAGIPTLQSLAYPLRGCGSIVCPVLNARKNELYSAVYDYTGTLTDCLAAPMAIKPGRLVELLSEMNRPVLFLGDGVPVYRKELEEGLGELACFTPLASNFPRGAAVAEMGLVAFQNGRGVDPMLLQPDYIRPSEAEIVWQKKNNAGGCTSGFNLSENEA